MKPGRIYTHHRSPPLNQLSGHPGSRNVYIFIKYVDNNSALAYNIYMGEIGHIPLRLLENYFVEAS